MGDDLAGTIRGRRLEEEGLSSLLQKAGTTVDNAAADRREILNLHLEGRARAELIFKKVSHRDVEQSPARRREAIPAD